MDILHLQPSEMGSEASDPYIQDLPYNGLPMFSDDMQGNLPLLPYATTQQYDLDAYSTTFEDPLSYQSGPLFEPFIEHHVNEAEVGAPDLDNKLLGFGPPIHKTPVIDQAGQTWPRLTAELNGMFCVAEDVFEGDATGRPLELTCYRRNLFQISGSITISRTVAHALVDQAHHVPIYNIVAVLSATESIEGKSSDIITVPWKSGNGAANGAAEEKTGTVPAEIPIDLSSSQEDDDPLFLNVPISWGRLQFKYATANNGRRKGLQQHYRIQISLMAKSEADGQMIKLVEVQTNPIVVRGRSPKNFDSSKDVPLSEKRADSRIRTSHMSSSVTGTPHWIEPALPLGSGKYYTQKSSEVSGWLAKASLTPGTTKAGSASPTSARRKPPVPSWDTISQETEPLVVKPPTGLSFTDDEEPSLTGSSTSTIQADKSSARSPAETVDALYEYFPLNLDDWMPPVDAIYRPHVVHHLSTAPEVSPQQIRSKPKRYFSADD
ncbi:MAG: hypothetical protein M1818_004372 [Claussenomyces sp. TS43310]|nr:MAG: hypothetical protein M1818_004372 [Claussenomyces sp. TS43310]